MIFQILLLFLLSIPLAVILLLLMPIRIRILAQKKGEFTQVVVSLFLAAQTIRFFIHPLDERLEIHVFNRKIISKSIVSEETKEKENRNGSSFKLEYVQPFMRFAYRMLNTFSLERIKLNLGLGLSDAYETGIVCGYLYPVLYPLNGLPNTMIQINPCFHEEKIDAFLEIQVMNKIGRFISPVMRLALDLDVKRMALGRIRNAI